jgi:hypothetical protein
MQTARVVTLTAIVLFVLSLPFLIYGAIGVVLFHFILKLW